MKKKKGRVEKKPAPARPSAAPAATNAVEAGAVKPLFSRNVMLYLAWAQNQVLSKSDVLEHLERIRTEYIPHEIPQPGRLDIELTISGGEDFIDSSEDQKKGKKTSEFRFKWKELMGAEVWVSKTPFPKDWNPPTPNVGKNLNLKPHTDLISFEIPAEIQQVMLTFLTASEVNSVSYVSKHWHSIANSNPVWRSLCLSIFPDDSQYESTDKDEEHEKSRVQGLTRLYKLKQAPSSSITAYDIHSNSEVENWKDEYVARLAKYRIIRQRKLDLHSQRMQHRYWMMCGVHMFARVNGRSGFDDLPAPELPAHIPVPSLETIKQMLRREDELRLSPATQAKFSDSNLDAILIAEDVQREVAKEFGYKDSEEDITAGVEIIRAAPALYPQNPEIKKIPHYLKYNRSKVGNLQAGDIVPNVPLSLLSARPTTLYSKLDAFGSESRPVVIVCGSYS
eukprot:TRINITY_DN3934_c0_g1_i1.p1 TRINITY_DN3934_c0_g1~~TRINITY_DN3934_c0_g1_i1.p1  ORF type:complete len:450 (+),score=88.38 TRINITY_DN3934_c0_g1_i1:163-1512(+)